MRLTMFLAAFASALIAQTLAFEAVSIKPGAEGSRKMVKGAGRLHEQIGDSHVELGSQTLSHVAQMAFELPENRISGPAWMDDLRFDISAKLPREASKSDVPRMLRTMLAERFHLAYHREQKTGPVYILAAGKGAPAMVKSADSTGGGCVLAAPPHHLCHHMTMEQLAALLTSLSAPGNQGWAPDRPVFDGTGLSGAWDFTLDYGAFLLKGRSEDNEGVVYPVSDGINGWASRFNPPNARLTLS